MNTKTLSLWMGIGSFALLGAGAHAADLHGQSGHGHGRQAPIQVAEEAHQHGEEGEAKEQDIFTEYPAGEALVGRLLMIKGHLMVGQELYQAGRLDDAAPHYFHPTEEIYALIKDEMAKRKLGQFEGDLKALAGLVKQKKPAADVFAKQKTVIAKLNKALVSADKKTPSFVMTVAPGVLSQAAEEYKEAFVDGKLTNAVEYQDGRGFVTAARAYVAHHAKGLGAKNAEGFKTLSADMDRIAQAFPTAVPPQQPVLEAGAVRDLVSKVELLKPSFK
ncbi:hypothetical protein [Azospirillum sp. sgz302134]